MPTASPSPPTTVLESSRMYPWSSRVYLISSSPTVAVSTHTKLSSARTQLSTCSRTAGSKTTSPFIHRTPPSRQLDSPRHRLFEVLVLA